MYSLFTISEFKQCQFQLKDQSIPTVSNEKRFYESTIAINFVIIHNKNNFSFHTPLDKTPGSEPRVFFLFSGYSSFHRTETNNAL